MSVTGYSRAQIGLHWTVAVLVVLQLVFGEAMSAAFDANIRSGTRVFTTSAVLHMATGSAILLLMFLRLTLRRERGVPQAPQSDPVWQQRAARGVHLAFYALLLAMPVAGALAWGTGNEGLGNVHALAGKVLTGLLLLHIGAALYGQFVQKSGILSRMATPRD